MIPTTLHALEEGAIPVFITQEARHLAQGFATQQSTPAKSDQVYRNTLAISMVQNYLRVLGIATDLAHCDSWNPMMRMMVNTADLEILGRGRLECRPVSSEELKGSTPTCYIPTEVQGDRIGYVVVHLEADEAILLGFAPKVETEQFPLTQLRPFSGLLAHLHLMPLDVEETITILGKWFQNVIDAGWQTMEELLGTPAVQYRQAPTTAPAFRQSQQSQQSQQSRQLGKMVASEITEEQVILVVTITAPIEFPAAKTAMDIQLKIQPSDLNSDLPSGLQLRLVDKTGATFMEAVNTEEHRLVKLDFKAETGDRFDVQIQWPNPQGEDTVVTERFVV